MESFYKHPRMFDGHLNKCKDCTKKDVSEKYQENMQNPEYIEKERVRGRVKYEKYRYKGKNDKPGRSISKIIKNRGIDMTEKEAHHWNYNLPNNVFILSRRAHAIIHKKLVYDENKKMFIADGTLLDTKEKHYNFIVRVIENMNIDKRIEYFETLYKQ